jgi:predicted small secreted protein
MLLRLKSAVGQPVWLRRSTVMQHKAKEHKVKESAMKRFSGKKVLIGSFMALMVMGVLSGCNTMAGLGQDVQEGGKAVQEAAS